MLVFCPLSLIEAAWRCDVERFSSFTFCNLRDGVTEADIYAVNYERIVRDAGFHSIVDLVRGGKWMVVLDESSRCKSRSATTTKNLLRLRNLFAYRMALSATPAPNSLAELWPQVAFLSDGILPSSYTAFKNEYFHMSRGNQVIPNGSFVSKAQMSELFKKGFQLTITPEKERALLERIAPIMHVVKKDECLDLPPVTDEVRIVELPPATRKVYNAMRRDFITEIQGRAITAQVALAKMMKLRQIVSGFAITPEGETVDLPENPKLAELQAFLDEAGDQQIIIWANFRHEIKRIVSALGKDAVALHGETKNRDAVIASFKSGGIKYLVAHPRTAAHGITWINCSLQVFYSLDYSWELYEQAKGRIHRAGQTKPCTYVHIISRDTIDNDIFKTLKNKGGVNDLIESIAGVRLAGGGDADDTSEVPGSVGLEDF
jgi:SNF2 family DNA or RNA helicase